MTHELTTEVGAVSAIMILIAGAVCFRTTLASQPEAVKINCWEYTLQAVKARCIRRSETWGVSVVHSMEFTMKELQPVLNEMLVHATTQLPADILMAIKEAHAHETKDLAKKQLEAILTSAGLSDEKGLPLCQDTGLVTLFVSGELVNHIGEVEKALAHAAQDLTAKGAMRANVVHPLTRKNTGTNTGLSQPEVLIDKSTDKTQMKMILKGAGSENFTNLKMMVPTASRQDMLKHILQVVIEAGGKTCPPNILGIGIGGSAIQAMFNSKRALLREIGSRHRTPMSPSSRPRY